MAAILGDVTSHRNTVPPRGLSECAEQTDTNEGNKEKPIETMQDDAKCDEEEDDADEIRHDNAA